MTVKLNELYKGESNHKSLWSRAKEGLGRFDKYMDQEDGTDWYCKDKTGSGTNSASY